MDFKFNPPPFQRDHSFSQSEIYEMRRRIAEYNIPDLGDEYYHLRSGYMKARNQVLSGKTVEYEELIELEDMLFEMDQYIAEFRFRERRSENFDKPLWGFGQ